MLNNVCCNNKPTKIDCTTLDQMESNHNAVFHVFHVFSTLRDCAFCALTALKFHVRLGQGHNKGCCKDVPSSKLTLSSSLYFSVWLNTEWLFLTSVEQKRNWSCSFCSFALSLQMRLTTKEQRICVVSIARETSFGHGRGLSCSWQGGKTQRSGAKTWTRLIHPFSIRTFFIWWPQSHLGCVNFPKRQMYVKQ